ncbi:tyrosine-protein phosphatase non-receptor type 9-like isoform X2 [Crassostrea angulata]|uniref:tyrosine-protein phosphatase non-receptor type 9-like isoform X2 n=1 Tax=Magallana angulata TaxID=2784310 RepID=UPI0022B1C9C7|nr:tyrosine-protein phosphatase non-receptor type 9-like isoform X2 [Crassostrea angulata]
MDNSVLTEEERKKVSAFQDKVNKQRRKDGQDSLPWNMAVKFLMARKFDCQRALELYLNHEETRHREDLTVIQASDELLKRELYTEKFTILSGRDKNGAAIALFTARIHQPSLTSHQLVLKALVYQLDAALESTETQRNGLVFIYDMTESKYSNFDYELSKKILNMLKGGYPARLKKVLIVTAPLWFKAPFKILRLFVKEKLRDRVYTINLSQLTQHIPQDALPEQLGGKFITNHKAWLQLCSRVALKEDPDMNTYFVSCKRPSTGDEQGSSCRSMSSDLSENMLHSDIDSEESKETVNEKQNNEDLEKEDSSDEKEVIVEKDDSLNLVPSKRRIDSVGNKDSVKRAAQETNSENNIDVDSVDAPRKKRPTSSTSSMSNNAVEDSLHMPEEDGMDLDQLVEYTRSMRRRGLMEEYASIKMEPPAGTFTVSKAKHNLPKNRYSDVLCLDHSRVKLSTQSNDLSSDYINANYVDGYMQKNAYISTQGPLPRTFGDFWRMVWEEQVMVIVMTTKAVERGRAKCGQYWPPEEDGEEQHENFLVINTRMEVYQDYSITWLFLLNTKSNESRQIYHLQFTSWPDYGTPSSAAAFLEFLFKVRACQEEAVSSLGSEWQGHALGPPIVVHCSAGIGRTGTFITTDISLRRLEHIQTVNIRETVRRIRSQRAFSIQMPDQYVFCHFAIIEHGMQEGVVGDVDWTGFDDSDSDMSD